MAKKTITPKQYSLQITPITVHGFNDLDKDLTLEFEDFYRPFFTQGVINIPDSFIKTSEKVFSRFDKKQRIALGDVYFNNFTVVTESLLVRKQYDVAFRLWTQILAFVKDWENKNKPSKLHKGTPYYFSAVSSIHQNDFDAALMSMHNALIEDKVNNPKWDEAPGYYFLTLNDQKPDQYFKPFVDGMVGFIRDRLDGQGSQGGKYKKHYYATRGGALTYRQFRSKFLDDKSVNEEVKYFFVYSIIRIWHLRRLHKSKVGDELMAPLIFTNALFSLLLVIDNLFKKWNNPGGSRWKFAAHLHELAKHEGWIPSSTTIKSYMQDLNVTNRSGNDFENWCKDLAGDGGRKYRTQNGRKLSTIEADFVLAYGLRNFSAHSIKSQKILWNLYTGILQSLLNSLFKILEIS
ncbi:hypothetical protein KKF92_00095 [Patescibacteria group bacterium]|nr:hypothetical protein [Patescibacteria group bacterium]